MKTRYEERDFQGSLSQEGSTQVEPLGPFLEFLLFLTRIRPLLSVETRPLRNVETHTRIAMMSLATGISREDRTALRGIGRLVGIGEDYSAKAEEKL